jgi:hypothetical protein
MINGFFSIVKQDIAFLTDYLDQPNPSKAQQDKVNLVGMRMFAVLGMAVSVIAGVRSFAANTASSAIFRLASAVALYTISHDVFVIGLNSEKGVLDQVVATGKGLWDDIKDLWHGRKTFDDVPRHPLSEGTFYRPVWDILLAQEE